MSGVEGLLIVGPCHAPLSQGCNLSWKLGLLSVLMLRSSNHQIRIRKTILSRGATRPSFLHDWWIRVRSRPLSRLTLHLRLLFRDRSRSLFTSCAPFPSNMHLAVHQCNLVWPGVIPGEMKERSQFRSILVKKSFPNSTLLFMPAYAFLKVQHSPVLWVA